MKIKRATADGPAIVEFEERDSVTDDTKVEPSVCYNCQIDCDWYYTCLECHWNLCDACVTYHLRSGHKVINCKMYTVEACRIHRWPLIEFCQTCDTGLCLNCLRRHGDHRRVELSKEAQSAKMLLHELSEEAEGKYNGISKLKAICNRRIKDMQDRNSKSQLLVNARKKVLESTVRSIAEISNIEIESQLSDLNLWKRNLDAARHKFGDFQVEVKTALDLPAEQKILRAIQMPQMLDALESSIAPRPEYSISVTNILHESYNLPADLLVYLLKYLGTDSLSESNEIFYLCGMHFNDNVCFDSDSAGNLLVAIKKTKSVKILDLKSGFVDQVVSDLPMSLESIHCAKGSIILLDSCNSWDYKLSKLTPNFLTADNICITGQCVLMKKQPHLYVFIAGGMIRYLDTSEFSIDDLVREKILCMAMNEKYAAIIPDFGPPQILKLANLADYTYRVVAKVHLVSTRIPPGDIEHLLFIGDSPQLIAATPYEAVMISFFDGMNPHFPENPWSSAGWFEKFDFQVETMKVLPGTILLRYIPAAKAVLCLDSKARILLLKINQINYSEIHTGC